MIMKRSFKEGAARRFAAAALALACAWPQGLAMRGFAAEATAVMEGLSVGDDTVTIKLSASAQYNGFLTAKPPRLVVELFDTENQVGAQALAGKGRFLKGVRAAQFQRSPRMISRVVMDLKEIAGYRLTQSGDNLVVQLVGESATGPAPSQSAAAAPKPAPAAVKPKIAVKTPEEEVSPELAAMAGGDAAPAAPAASGPDEEETTARASGLAKRVSRPDVLSRMPKDLVTLEFDATDIRDVFKLLAAKAKINIIYGSDVAGLQPVTLHLNDVPFNEAVQTILSMSGLVTTQVGDSILRVLTPAQMAKERNTATTITKIIPLNYTKASDILSAINTVRTAEGRTGSATADSKTNSLVLTESPDGMATEERLVAQLDVRPKQVLIEAKLIEVTLSNSLNTGIQWNYFGLDQGRAFGKNGTTAIGTPVGQAGANGPTTGSNMNGNAATQMLTGTNPNTLFPTGAAGPGTGVGLPAANIFGALTLGRITNNYILNMTLTAAATQGKVKVLSDPKVATLNNQPANINVTTQYPYVTSSIASTAGGAVTSQVTYVSVGIQLTVTPTINADGRITLNINPQVSQPSATAPTVGGAPGIDQRAAQTTILVKDGETIVIGGLISDHMENTVNKIPLLGDIPVLGWLFRSKSVTRTRSELLIFVTPKILAD